MLGPMPSDNEVRPGMLGRDYGDVLWQPGPEVIERARITAYRRWLGAERGVTSAVAPGRRPTPNCTAGRSPSQGRSGTRSGTTSRWPASAAKGPCSPAPRCRTSPGSPVPPSTTRATPCGPRDRPRQDRGDRPRRGGPPGHADLRRTRRRGGPGAGRAGGTRGDQGRPGRRVPAQHPGRAHRPARHREPGRDLVLVLARLRAAQRDRPLRADHPEGAAGHRAATGTAARSSTGGRRWRTSPPPCRAWPR